MSAIGDVVDRNPPPMVRAMDALCRERYGCPLGHLLRAEERLPELEREVRMVVRAVLFAAITAGDVRVGEDSVVLVVDREAATVAESSIDSGQVLAHSDQIAAARRFKAALSSALAEGGP